MSEFLSMIIGVLVPFVVSWLMSKIRPELIVGWMTRILDKVIESNDAKNRIENTIGLRLVDIGIQIIEQTEENSDEAKQQLAIIKDEIENFKFLVR